MLCHTILYVSLLSLISSTIALPTSVVRIYEEPADSVVLLEASRPIHDYTELYSIGRAPVGRESYPLPMEPNGITRVAASLDGVGAERLVYLLPRTNGALDPTKALIHHHTEYAKAHKEEEAKLRTEANGHSERAGSLFEQAKDHFSHDKTLLGRKTHAQAEFQEKQQHLKERKANEHKEKAATHEAIVDHVHKFKEHNEQHEHHLGESERHYKDAELHEHNNDHTAAAESRRLGKEAFEHATKSKDKATYHREQAHKLRNELHN